MLLIEMKNDYPALTASLAKQEQMEGTELVEALAEAPGCQSQKGDRENG